MFRFMLMASYFALTRGNTSNPFIMGMLMSSSSKAIG